MECEVSTVHIIEKTNFSLSQTLIDGVARSNTSRNRCRIAQRMKVSISPVLGKTMESLALGRYLASLTYCLGLQRLSVTT